MNDEMDKKHIKGTKEYDADTLKELKLQGWDLEELWYLFNKYTLSEVLNKLVVNYE